MGELQEYGKAKLALHNAKQTADALGKKYRNRANRIKALRIELAQLEKSMPALTDRLKQSENDLKAAREAFRPLRRERKYEPLEGCSHALD